MASFPHDGVMWTCKSPRPGKEEQRQHLLKHIISDNLPLQQSKENDHQIQMLIQTTIKTMQIACYGPPSS